MSHTVYSTDAIVLKRESTGEADTTVWLLTRELGLIIARAQSARKESAKMRGYLQTFAYLKVSLVRGRYAWRITGTEQSVEAVQSDTLDTHNLRGGSLSAFARISTFLRRMTVSDTQSALELFGIMLTARQNLVNNVEMAELTAMTKILIVLGYLDPGILENVYSNKISENNLLADVNKAIVESQL